MSLGPPDHRRLVSGDSDTLAMMRQLGYVSGAEDAQDPDGHRAVE